MNVNGEKASSVEYKSHFLTISKWISTFCAEQWIIKRRKI
jgi:hypothetical protein